LQNKIHIIILRKKPAATFLLEKESSDDGLVLQRIHGVRAEHKSAADSQLRGAGIQHSTHTTSRHHTNNQH